ADSGAAANRAAGAGPEPASGTRAGAFAGDADGAGRRGPADGSGGPPAHRSHRTDQAERADRRDHTAATRPESGRPARARGAPTAPLPLAPQAGPDAPAPAPAPVPPPAPPSHTTALASTGPATAERNSAGGSGYYVQVSAQKSEEEAKSSFQSIQARHATLLGGQQLFVRRKDLGAKGVFYGAQVGPLSHDAANKLCEGLKAAGQAWMVQRN